MNPQEFLEVAEDLTLGSREADWRTAASRAYYAAVHVGRNLLRNNGFNPPSVQQTHRYLWLRLANCAHPDVMTAGIRLRRLRNKRNQADYDLHVFFDQVAAADHLALAVSTIQTLEDLTKLPSVLANVLAAIRAFERDVLGEVTWQS